MGWEADQARVVLVDLDSCVFRIAGLSDGLSRSRASAEAALAFAASRQDEEPHSGTGVPAEELCGTLEEALDALAAAEHALQGVSAAADGLRAWAGGPDSGRG